MNTGHDGSMNTIQPNSPREAQSSRCFPLIVRALRSDLPISSSKHEVW